jgi:hypothetical protein
MLDLPQLRTAIDEAIDGFADRVGDIVPAAAAFTPKRTAAPRRTAAAPKRTAAAPKRTAAAPKGTAAAPKGTAPERTSGAPVPNEESSVALTTLGRKVLRAVSDNPMGVTANDIADKVHVGFAPIFDELRSLMASGALLRIVRGDDQLPVYVVPNR